MIGFMGRAALGCAFVLAAISATQAADLSRVSVGITNSASDVSLFVAHKRGYFREEGLDVAFVSFPSAASKIEVTTPYWRADIVLSCLTLAVAKIS